MNVYLDDDSSKASLIAIFRKAGHVRGPIFQSSRTRLACALAVLLVVLAAGTWLAADWYIAIPADAQASYVGTQRCVSCHQAQHHAWLGSHHDRAMELASPESVLGDFEDAEFARLGVTTRFFMQGGKYYVNTEGPDG